MATQIEKLAVVENVKAALVYTFSHGAIFAKSIAIWLGILAGICLVFIALGGGEYFDLMAQENQLRWQQLWSEQSLLSPIVDAIIARDQSTNELGIIFKVFFPLSLFIPLIAGYSVAVSWHRALLLNQSPPWTRFSKLEFKYMLYTVFLAMVWAAVVYCAGILPYIGGVFTVILASVLVPILGVPTLLVLPSLAIDDKQINYDSCWRIAKGNGGRLALGLILMLLISLPFVVLVYILQLLNIPAYINLPLQLLLSLFSGLFFLSYLSICYQFFVAQLKLQTQSEDNNETS